MSPALSVLVLLFGLTTQAHAAGPTDPCAKPLLPSETAAELARLHREANDPHSTEADRLVRMADLQVVLARLEAQGVHADILNRALSNEAPISDADAMAPPTPLDVAGDTLIAGLVAESGSTLGVFKHHAQVINTYYGEMVRERSYLKIDDFGALLYHAFHAPHWNRRAIGDALIHIHQNYGLYEVLGLLHTPLSFDINWRPGLEWEPLTAMRANLLDKPEHAAFIDTLIAVPGLDLSATYKDVVNQDVSIAETWADTALMTPRLIALIKSGRGNPLRQTVPGRTLLHIALASFHLLGTAHDGPTGHSLTTERIAIFNALLDHVPTAFLNIKDRAGSTPLHLLVSDPQMRANRFFDDAYRIRYQEILPPILDTIERLLALPPKLVDFSIKDSGGQTARERLKHLVVISNPILFRLSGFSSWFAEGQHRATTERAARVMRLMREREEGEPRRE